MFFESFWFALLSPTRKPKSRRFWRWGMVACMAIYPIAVRPHLGLVACWLDGYGIMSWMSMLHQVSNWMAMFLRENWQLFTRQKDLLNLLHGSSLWTPWCFWFRNNTRWQHEYLWRSKLLSGLHWQVNPDFYNWNKAWLTKDEQNVLNVLSKYMQVNSTWGSTWKVICPSPVLAEDCQVFALYCDGSSRNSEVEGAQILGPQLGEQDARLPDSLTLIPSS